MSAKMGAHNPAYSVSLVNYMSTTQPLEEECLQDADKRAARREREEVCRAEQDRDLVARTAGAILELFPSCPPAAARAIAAHHHAHHDPAG